MMITALIRRSFRRLGRCAVSLVVTARTIMARQWFNYIARENHLSTGVNEKWIVTTRSHARENSDDSPYLIPNEWIASNIAWMMRLPVPPFALMRKGRTRKGMFGCLEFGESERRPHDVRPSRCVACLPDLCTGIVVFDVLVANSDRHAGNLQVNDPFNPREMYVYDHDRAIFGAHRGRARTRLQRLLDRLGISAGSVTGDNRHCFLDELSTAAYFARWIRRATTVPDWFIDEICGDVTGMGVNKAHTDIAADFLKHRKKNLGAIINAHQSAFPGVHDWGMFT
jgi:hypothetical protein